MGLVYVIFFIVSFGASIIGAICGIGGGVIIKPVLDAFGVLDVSTIGFLSGCTVLMMSCYSVVRSKLSGTSGIELGIGTPLAIGAAVGGVAGKSMYQWVASLFTDANTVGAVQAIALGIIELGIGTPLAIGAAVGGVAGKSMYQWVASLFTDANTVGAVQAIALGIITVGTLIYTVKKDRIKTYHLRNKAVCLLIGFLLGIMSSFLGIGGGPINLVVLFFFFSMSTKVAAQNSLYIILFSQATSFLGIMSSFLGIGGGPINLVVLFFFFSMSTKVAAQNSLYIILFSQATSFLQTLITRTVPDVSLLLLLGMVAAGLLGGIAGRSINKKIDDNVVNKLFIALMAVIILINIYNTVKYLGLLPI